MRASEKQLLNACKILFASDVQISPDFLQYLQRDGVISAFRRKALAIHPDRQKVNGYSCLNIEESFTQLCRARDLLLQFLNVKNEDTKRNGKKQTLATEKSERSVKRLLFGRYLCDRGFISKKQLIDALTWQKMSRPRLGELGVQHQLIKRDAILAILKRATASRPFGMTAVDLRLLTREDVEFLLKKQKQLQQRIGQYFINNRLLSEQELEWCLKQLRLEREI